MLRARPDVLPDVLDLPVLVEAGWPKFAADPGLLVSAPLGLRHVRVVVVDPDGAVAKPPGNPLSAAGILRPHGSGESVDGVVGDGDSLVLIAEAFDSQHRAE